MFKLRAAVIRAAAPHPMRVVVATAFAVLLVVSTSCNAFADSGSWTVDLRQPYGVVTHAQNRTRLTSHEKPEMHVDRRPQKNGSVRITFMATSTTGLSSSQNPSTAGQFVTFTATVTGARPTGTVTFEDGINVIPGCDYQPLSGGVATCTVDATTRAGQHCRCLAPGSHSITAIYSGDSFNSSSSSLPLT